MAVPSNGRTELRPYRRPPQRARSYVRTRKGVASGIGSRATRRTLLARCSGGKETFHPATGFVRRFEQIANPNHGVLDSESRRLSVKACIDTSKCDAPLIGALRFQGWSFQ